MATRTVTPAAGHPPGLYVLFMTELWERYSFYSMMAILTLYMDEQLHFSKAWSAQIYGGYIGAVYFMPLIGGFLADRVLGFNKAIVLGGILMAIGQLMLAVGRIPMFYAALGMLACGAGLLKPNVSTVIGNLYRDRPQLRDAGYNIYYMGINIGALISPLAVSWFRARYGWSVAFASAAVPMLFSLVTYVGFNRYVGEAAHRIPPHAAAAHDDLQDKGSRITLLLVVFAISVAFWIAFYQNGYTLTFWARDNTITSWPPERFQSVEPLGVILFSPVLVWLWAALRRRNAEPSTPMKMLIGIGLTAGSFLIMAVAAGPAGGDTGRVAVWWLVTSYLVIAVGEICLSPMGLSLVNKLAPPRMRGLLMGGWFVATSMGGYFSGVLGAYWDRLPHSRFFVLVVAVLAVAWIALFAVLRPAKRVIDAATV